MEAIGVLAPIFSGSTLAVMVAIFFELRSIKEKLGDHARKLEDMSTKQARNDRLTGQLARRLSYVIGRLRWPDNAESDGNGQETVV